MTNTDNGLEAKLHLILQRYKDGELALSDAATEIIDTVRSTEAPFGLRRLD